jgi:hypothetical protein
MTTPIGSPAANVPIYIKRGSDWSATFTLYDAEDNVIDLTGSSFAGKIRKKRLSPISVASFVFEIDEDTNEVTVTIDKEVIRLIDIGEKDDDLKSRYVYDWEWTRPNETVDRIQEGIVTISAEVTR